MIKLGIVMDPIAAINIKKDTSFAMSAFRRRKPAARWATSSMRVAAWNNAAPRTALPFTMISRITRRLYWPRWQPYAAKSAARRGSWPYWSPAPTR